MTFHRLNWAPKGQRQGNIAHWKTESCSTLKRFSHDNSFLIEFNLPIPIDRQLFAGHKRRKLVDMG
jgi:hypothetical protein